MGVGTIRLGFSARKRSLLQCVGIVRLALKLRGALQLLRVYGLGNVGLQGSRVRLGHPKFYNSPPKANQAETLDKAVRDPSNTLPPTKAWKKPFHTQTLSTHHNPKP